METNIPVSLEMWMEPDGTIRSDLYVGDISEPAVEAEGRLMVMIDDLLDSMSIQGKIAEYHYEECDQLVSYLKDVVRFTKKRIKEKK